MRAQVIPLILSLGCTFSTVVGEHILSRHLDEPNTKGTNNMDSEAFLFNSEFIHYAVDLVPSLAWFILSIVSVILAPIIMVKGIQLKRLTLFFCITSILFVLSMYAISEFILKDINGAEKKQVPFWMAGAFGASTLLGLIGATVLSGLKFVLFLPLVALSAVLVTLGFDGDDVELVVIGFTIFMVATLSLVIVDIVVIILSVSIGGIAFALGVSNLLSLESITPQQLALYPIEVVTCMDAGRGCMIVMFVTLGMMVLGLFSQISILVKQKKKEKSKAEVRLKRSTNASSSVSSSRSSTATVSTPDAPTQHNSFTFEQDTPYAEIYPHHLAASAPPVPTATVVRV